MALSDITCAAWLGLLYFPLDISCRLPPDSVKLAVFAVTAVGAGRLLIGTESSP
jgi:hypothetical protein